MPLKRLLRNCSRRAPGQLGPSVRHSGRLETLLKRSAGRPSASLIDARPDWSGADLHKTCGRRERSRALRRSKKASAKARWPSKQLERLFNKPAPLASAIALLKPAIASPPDESLGRGNNSRARLGRAMGPMGRPPSRGIERANNLPLVAASCFAVARKEAPFGPHFWLTCRPVSAAGTSSRESEEWPCEEAIARASREQSKFNHLCFAARDELKASLTHAATRFKNAFELLVKRLTEHRRREREAGKEREGCQRLILSRPLRLEQLAGCGPSFQALCIEVEPLNFQCKAELPASVKLGQLSDFVAGTQLHDTHCATLRLMRQDSCELLMNHGLY